MIRTQLLIRLWVAIGGYVCMLLSAYNMVDASLTTFNQLMERSVVPLPMAKVFSLNDRYDARVCVLNNIFSENQDLPKQCTCSFARLRAIELMCANGQTYGGYDCNKNICETCCTLSMSATSTTESKHSDYPVNCKMRCINSLVASDVTEDSHALLSDLLRKVNALYHPEPHEVKQPDDKDVPTKYHVIPLEEQHDDTF